jgi:hypothetical protein
MRARLALLALLVVLSGCAGTFTAERPVQESPATPTAGGAPATTATPDAPTATPDGTTAASSPVEPTATPTPRPPTPTPRDAGKVEVAGLPLSFDEEQVYRDVVTMQGQSYESAPAVDLRVKETPAPSRTSQVWDVSEFMLLWGFDPSALGNTDIAGLTIRDRVFLYAEPVPNRTGRMAVLAHEYTHVLQHETDAFSRTSQGVRRGEGSTDRVYLAVVEGAASYVQRRYVARHLDEEPRNRTWATYSGNRTRFGAYAVAPYYFGERYVDRRIDDPANVSSVYRRPPTTTEQVIHGYAPGEEPARPLAVDVDAGDDWFRTDERVRGELFVRLVLESELSRERAAEAAAGWGADRVVTVEDSETGTLGHAWVLRWDSPGEAEEFAGAMTDYLDARGETAGDRWTDGDTTFGLRWVDDETVVVVAGPDRFVDAASVESEDGDVTVRVGG